MILCLSLFYWLIDVELRVFLTNLLVEQIERPSRMGGILIDFVVASGLEVVIMIFIEIFKRIHVPLAVDLVLVFVFSRRNLNPCFVKSAFLTT